MAVDGWRPSLAAMTEDSVDLEVMRHNLTGDVCLRDGAKKSITDPVIRAATGPLVIRDNVVDVPMMIAYVEGKGKSVVCDNEIQTPRVTRNSKEKMNVDLLASSSEMNIYVNRFGYSNAISGPVLEINANFNFPVNINLHFEDSLTTKEVGIVDKVNEVMPSRNGINVENNPGRKNHTLCWISKMKREFLLKMDQL
ncbi:hypothetical protein MA16_Dca026669 [Dendrobium catenatum]|uniref:Uncharacterized protein n=1 Tax=Dendrobium catenatum TaxID=906689 RepID=A0A2I0VMS1_9ASPA|nr:hypothetical protein MA16_Dca026669 [Dendrobium catenatum]